MAVDNTIIISGIKPICIVLGDTQQFEFNQKDAFFSIKNLFQATSSIPVSSNYEFKNWLENGFRIRHETDVTGGVGVLKFLFFENATTSGTDVLTIDKNNFILKLSISVPNPTISSHATNKSYVDNVINGIQKTITLQGDVSGSGITGSSITTTLNKRLDQIPAPTASVSLNSQKLINLASPLLPTDGVNRDYADTSTILPSRIKNYPTDSKKYLSGDGNWTIPAGSSSGDSYQTLTSASSVTWDWSLGNIANITLTMAVTLSITPGLVSRGTLIVKQDGTGSRTLSLKPGLFKQGSDPKITLSTSANAIDILQFVKDENNNVYSLSSNLAFIAITASQAQKFVFDYDDTQRIRTLIIPDSPSKVCKIRLLGAGGGQGIYSQYNTPSGESGAGGYTVYHFKTDNYINQQLNIIVGQGGEGGICPSRGGEGGYPNGGTGSGWSYGFLSGEFCGGGGGRSEVRLGTVLLAIAGGGGGSSGYNFSAGAGGGEVAQAIANSPGTGGNQVAGGFVSSYGSLVSFSGQFKGAGALSTTDLYCTGGGGDGYYGGGIAGQYAGGGGGSGYTNNSLALQSFNGVSTGTYTGNFKSIPAGATSDNDFNKNNYGVGWPSLSNGRYFSALRGGNGRVIVEFL